MIDSRAKMALGPIDLTQLRRQTGGDARLEREVLGMFAAKAAADLKRIAAAPTAAARREAAHALVGSARAVGASQIARLAAEIEASADHVADVADLRKAVDAARAFIGTHLADQ
jgi:HPt (histidine-containing phosphotransfer) domain-containing protein